MPQPDGAGSQRIVVLGGERRRAPDALDVPDGVDRPGPGPVPLVARRPVRARPARARPVHGERPPMTHAMQHNGWTIQRLTIAAALGATAVVAGGLVFVAKFGGDRAAGDNPFMAVAFGLFVIGMVVFCASVIALIGTGVSMLAEARGWTPAALAVLAPLALVWLLYLAGAVGYAIPAVLSLVLIGGLVVALK